MNELEIRNATLARASLRSRSDGRLRFVFGGSRITLRRPRDTDSLWTNGEQCGCWHASESIGRFDPVLTNYIDQAIGAPQS